MLVLLLVRRLTVKAEILLAQLRERFPAPAAIDRPTVLKSHTVEQYCFGARLIHLLLALQVRTADILLLRRRDAPRAQNLSQFWRGGLYYYIKDLMTLHNLIILIISSISRIRYLEAKHII